MWTEDKAEKKDGMTEVEMKVEEEDREESKGELERRK